MQIKISTIIIITMIIASLNNHNFSTMEWGVSTNVNWFWLGRNKLHKQLSWPFQSLWLWLIKCYTVGLTSLLLLTWYIQNNACRIPWVKGGLGLTYRIRWMCLVQCTGGGGAAVSVESILGLQVHHHPVPGTKIHHTRSIQGSNHCHPHPWLSCCWINHHHPHAHNWTMWSKDLHHHHHHHDYHQSEQSQL